MSVIMRRLPSPSIRNSCWSALCIILVWGLVATCSCSFDVTLWWQVLASMVIIFMRLLLLDLYLCTASKKLTQYAFLDIFKLPDAGCNWSHQLIIDIWFPGQSLQKLSRVSTELKALPDDIYKQSASIQASRQHAPEYHDQKSRHWPSWLAHTFFSAHALFLWILSRVQLKK